MVGSRSQVGAGLQNPGWYSDPAGKTEKEGRTVWNFGKVFERRDVLRLVSLFRPTTGGTKVFDPVDVGVAEKFQNISRTAECYSRSSLNLNL